MDEVGLLRRLVVASDEYVQMLEYCAGGMIREFGATFVQKTTKDYQDLREKYSELENDRTADNRHKAHLERQQCGDCGAPKEVPCQCGF